jgi:hypothetical protein
VPTLLSQETYRARVAHTLAILLLSLIVSTCAYSGFMAVLMISCRHIVYSCCDIRATYQLSWRHTRYRDDKQLRKLFDSVKLLCISKSSYLTYLTTRNQHKSHTHLLRNGCRRTQANAPGMWLFFVMTVYIFSNDALGDLMEYVIAIYCTW